jgi:hypothetical protein
MSDERLAQRLEEQLRDAHATNAELRDRLGDVEQRERATEAKMAEANFRLSQLERAHANRRQPRTTLLLHSESRRTPSAMLIVRLASWMSCAKGSRSCEPRQRPSAISTLGSKVRRVQPISSADSSSVRARPVPGVGS